MNEIFNNVHTISRTSLYYVYPYLNGFQNIVEGDGTTVMLVHQVEGIRDFAFWICFQLLVEAKEKFSEAYITRPVLVVVVKDEFGEWLAVHFRKAISKHSQEVKGAHAQFTLASLYRQLTE